MIYNVGVSPSTKKQSNFRIDADIMEGLNRIKERDGVPLSEQVRRALRAWLESQSDFKPARKRAVTRKRPSHRQRREGA